MRFYVLIIAQIMLVNSLSAQPTLQQNSFNSIFSTKFNSLLNSTNNGLWYSSMPNNLNGHFEEDSKVILGLLNLYESTNQVEYLQNAIKHFDLILSKRDDKTSSTHNNLKTWSTKTDAILCNSNTPIGIQGIGFSNVYNDGSILYPMAKFVRLVYQKSSIRNVAVNNNNNNWQFWQNGMTFLQIANSLIENIQETISVYEVSWNNTKKSYTFSSIINPYLPISKLTNVEGLALPLNQNHSIGRVFLELLKANTYNSSGSLSTILNNNSSMYANKVSLMIDCFKLELNIYSPVNYDFYQWRYFETVGINSLPNSNPCYPSFTKNSENDNIEDYSHAEITLDFVYLSFYHFNGLNNFTANDMSKFAKTIKRAYTFYNINNSFFKSGLSTYNDVDGTLNNGSDILGCTNLNKMFSGITYHMLYSDFDQELYQISLDNIKFYTSTINTYANVGYSSTQMHLATLAHKFIKNQSPLTFGIFGSNFSLFTDNNAPNLCSYQNRDLFSDLVSGNFFGDSKSEILTVSRNGSNLRLFNFNTISNTLTLVNSYQNNSSNNMLWYLAAGNFDSDFYYEIIGYRWNDEKFYCYEVLSNGTIISSNLNFNDPSINKANLGGICVGNFDDDIHNEIATVNFSSGNIQILKKNLNNNVFYVFKELINSGSNALYKGITAADLDGDGIDEIAVMRNYDGNIYTYKSTSNYFLSPYVSHFVNNGNINWVDITSSDVNNDGKDEIILTNSSDGDFYYFNLDNGNLNNFYKEHFSPLLEINCIAVSNIEGDCFKDIIYTKNIDNTIHVDEYVIRNHICKPIFSETPQKNGNIENNDFGIESKNKSKYNFISSYEQLQKHTSQRNVNYFEVFDMSGRKIIDGNTNVDELVELSAGFYIINIKYTDNFSESIRYIIK